MRKKTLYFFSCFSKCQVDIDRVMASSNVDPTRTRSEEGWVSCDEIVCLKMQFFFFRSFSERGKKKFGDEKRKNDLIVIGISFGRKSNVKQEAKKNGNWSGKKKKEILKGKKNELEDRKSQNWTNERRNWPAAKKIAKTKSPARSKDTFLLSSPPKKWFYVVK